MVKQFISQNKCCIYIENALLLGFRKCKCKLILVINFGKMAFDTLHTAHNSQNPCTILIIWWYAFGARSHSLNITHKPNAFERFNMNEPTKPLRVRWITWKHSHDEFCLLFDCTNEKKISEGLFTSMSFTEFEIICFYFLFPHSISSISFSSFNS